MAPTSMDVAAGLRKRLAETDPDLHRELIATMVQALMAAEVDGICGAGYGEISPERVNSRNGYRLRPWDTWAGSIGLPIPKQREASYFPDGLLQPRRRAERALVAVVAEAYLLGVSTRRVEGLVQAMGNTAISKSQVPAMAGSLDQLVIAFRDRPLDRGLGLHGLRRSGQRRPETVPGLPRRSADRQRHRPWGRWAGGRGGRRSWLVADLVPFQTPLPISHG